MASQDSKNDLSSLTNKELLAFMARALESLKVASPKVSEVADIRNVNDTDMSDGFDPEELERQIAQAEEAIIPRINILESNTPPFSFVASSPVFDKSAAEKAFANSAEYAKNDEARRAQELVAQRKAQELVAQQKAVSKVKYLQRTEDVVEFVPTRKTSNVMSEVPLFLKN